MNTIAWIILSALILDYLLHLLADSLNLRDLKTSPPEEFKAYYEPERYRRSQAYLRENTRFGWLSASLKLFVVLVFWFGGGFPWLDAMVRALGWGTVSSGVLFIGLLVLLHGLLSLPLQCYATFVIEARYGFNRTSTGTFVLDRIKGVILGVLIGGPLLAGILYFF